MIPSRRLHPIQFDSSRTREVRRAPIGRAFSALFAGLFLFAGCEALDPTQVTNPTVTEDDFLQTPNAAASWARGVERQLATAVNQVILGAEIASDNMFNNRTLFSRVFDIPEIVPSDNDVTNIQRAVHRLRAAADRGLDVVVPGDPQVTDETRALLHFQRGYAYLLAGELFVALPAEENGVALSPADHLARAVEDFEAARTLSPAGDLRTAATLGLARAHHRAGNRTAAVAEAEVVRSSSPDFVRMTQFDATDGPSNQMQFAIYDSGQDEFQPLPRLDFLFPKYFSRSAGAQSPVAILKAEEAFLILAEAAHSTGDLAQAQTYLLELMERVAARPVESINDSGQRRGRQGGTWIFPNRANVLVAAGPGEMPRTGLVLTRDGGPVQVPVISGTSVTPAMVGSATSSDGLLELIYLLRQEIFVAEGRRMTDLGIRFPVALIETETNPNVSIGTAATTAQIPEFIPRDREMNAFTYEDGDTLAVIRHNLNRVLVQNRTSSLVLPFH